MRVSVLIHGDWLIEHLARAGDVEPERIGFNLR
jgi:hypothetical protein